MNCYCCNKQKNQLTPVESKIIKGSVLLMCATCIQSNFEPRWIIILGARQFGHESVSKYVSKKLYYGKDILASELVID